MVSSQTDLVVSPLIPLNVAYRPLEKLGNKGSWRLCRRFVKGLEVTRAGHFSSFWPTCQAWQKILVRWEKSAAGKKWAQAPLHFASPISALWMVVSMFLKCNACVLVRTIVKILD